MLLLVERRDDNVRTSFNRAFLFTLIDGFGGNQDALLKTVSVKYLFLRGYMSLYHCYTTSSNSSTSILLFTNPASRNQLFRFSEFQRHFINTRLNREFSIIQH